MNTSANDHTDHTGNPEELLHLTLDGLLPPDHTLIVNPAMRSATLLSHAPDDDAHIVAQQHFSPNGMRVLIPLLQAYPQYCPYEVLLARLFLLTPDDARRQLQEAWDMAIRPVRRAIGGLVAGLRAIGLRVRNIRGAGYLVEAYALQPH